MDRIEEEIQRLHSFGYSSDEIQESGLLREFFPYQDINILSFTVPVDDAPVPDGNEVPNEPALTGIWANLEKVIRAQVKKDGIKGDSIQPGQTEAQVFEDAVAIIYYDIAELYGWYFNPDDDRSYVIKDQKTVVVPPEVEKAVRAVVDDNLDAMREVDEIPKGKDVEGLNVDITKALSQYIVNWQDWFYDRKREEDIDNYFEEKSFYDDIYLESDYGNEDNVLDANQFDGISDVPYLTKELNL